MAAKSAIEWTESTWNPLTGCTKISPGCKHCYAERMAVRLQAMGQPNYARGFELAMQENSLGLPLKWKKPQTIFVNSMSDLFHKAVPVEFILKIFEVMCRADWHRYQILTKRSDRLLELSPKLPWKSHIWMGVSVETLDYAIRIEHLRKTGAMVKFLSLEPLLGPLPGLNLEGVDWVIVGGESGPGARAVDPAWVLEIREQCQTANVPFFFKQWGGTRKKKAGRELEGRTWDEMPALASTLAF
jgi:protein gp37